METRLIEMAHVCRNALSFRQRNMKILLFIIRLCFLPLKLITDLVYRKQAPSLFGHSWYSRNEYEKMLKAAEDEDDLISSYLEWKENAEQKMDEMHKLGWIVVKVTVRNSELNKWLREQGLSNTEENREEFVARKLKKFWNDPVI